jgi:hypothetical protein
VFKKPIKYKKTKKKKKKKKRKDEFQFIQISQKLNVFVIDFDLIAKYY